MEQEPCSFESQIEYSKDAGYTGSYTVVDGQKGKTFWKFAEELEGRAPSAKLITEDLLRFERNQLGPCQSTGRDHCRDTVVFPGTWYRHVDGNIYMMAFVPPRLDGNLEKGYRVYMKVDQDSELYRVAIPA